MIPIPYHQVVEFLNWLSEQQRIPRVEGVERGTLRQLALQYLRDQSRPHRLNLSRVLQIFQICPMIGEPDVRGQMRHFVGCGRCLHYIRERYEQYHEWVTLHPFLEGFLQFCQQREWAEVLESRARDFDRASMREVPEHLDQLFHEYIHRVGPELMRAFEEYYETADPELVRDYEARRRDWRDLPRRPVRPSEEGTIPLGTNESLEQAAERLVGSLYLLLEGQFYREVRVEPQVYRLMAAMGLLSADAAQGIEFLSWLQEEHPKLNLLGNVPSQEILELVLDFCDKKGYANAKSFSQEVTKWLRGDIERLVLQRLTEMGATARPRNRRGAHAVSPLTRYQTIPYHAMFLFLSAGDFPEFIRKYWEDLNYLTADWLDIYYSVEDLQRRVSGYEVLEQLRSVRLEPMSLPALLLWRQSLSDCCVIPLERLSHDEVFDLMKLVVQRIVEEKGLKNICVEAQAFVQQRVSGAIHIPQIIIEQGEITMKKEETRISEVSISGVSGQVFLGRFNDIIANLNAVGRNELGEALKVAQKAVMASQDLSDEQKQEQIEVINQIGEEAAKAKPNRTLLKSLGDGLMNTVKAIPDVAKAIAAITEILSKFYL